MRKLRSGQSVAARRRSDVEELRSPCSGKTFGSRYPGVHYQWISGLWSMNQSCHSSLMRCLEDRLKIHMVSHCKYSPSAFKLSSLTVIITLMKLLVLRGVWRRRAMSMRFLNTQYSSSENAGEKNMNGTYRRVRPSVYSPPYSISVVVPMVVYLPMNHSYEATDLSSDCSSR